MNYLPDDAFRDPKKPKPPSMGRMAVWLFVAAVGVYLIVSGIIGGLS
jgi:hypothetical protein